MVPGWHPIVVHFVVAPAAGGGLALWGARLARSPGVSQMLAIVGTWNFCAAAIVALFALATGMGAIWDLHLTGAVRAAVSLHAQWAIFTTLALLMLSVWRAFGSAADSRPSWLFLILASGVIAAVLITGFHGGENVFRYGIGVLPHG